MPQPGTAPSQFRCIECDRTVSREDVLWAHKGEQFDGATCVCEDCLPQWKEKMRPPDLGNVEDTGKHESFIAHYIKHVHDKWVERRHEKMIAEAEHVLGEFIRVSHDDPSMSAILLAVAVLTKEERHELLDILVTQLEDHQAHPELVDALHELRIEETASKLSEQLS